MAATTPPELSTDFAGVRAYLSDTGLLPAQPPQQLLRATKTIHHCTYTLILWRFRSRETTPHKRVFLDEIASDALQILPQSLAGFGKTVSLLIRGIIENTLRHVYFFDHPIEYTRMNLEEKWYVTVEDLFDYTRKHPTASIHEKKFDAINRLRQLYDELSADVHGRKVSNLEMRIALRGLVFRQTATERHASLVAKCSEACNFLLATFHHEEWSTWSSEDRKITRWPLCSQARRALAGIE